ncbi:porin family protein [Salibacter halophilus]|uniref:Porin family protein n=1 Tax=Salibacter halophilus TaxID=1803916 RepID=A0A6N6M2R2_9FLAO|nr:outer membrane beta-barrel protein [Salibacter halophilus]KAB1063366.1 porin family protein [Salibacter halophilus]
MKRLTLIIGIFFFAGLLRAQLDSVNFSIGGNIGFDIMDRETSTTNTFNLALKPAYHFNENIAVGIIAENTLVNRIDESQNSIQKDSELTDNFLTLGLFGRYYKPVANRAYLFGELNAGYLFGSRTIDNSSGKSVNDVNGYSANLLLGASYFFTPRLSGSLNIGMLGYRSETYSPENGNENTTTYFESGIDAANPSLSVRLFF